MKKSIALVAATTLALSSLSFNAAAKDNCDTTTDGEASGALFGASAGVIIGSITGFTICGPAAPVCVLAGSGIIGLVVGKEVGKTMDSAFCNEK